jgi:glycerate 2-kinase
MSTTVPGAPSPASGSPATRRANEPITGTASGDETSAGLRAGHVLVACDKFKGTLSAHEVATCIADGLRAVAPGVSVVAVPVADGGDGTLIAVEEAGFDVVPVTVDGPTGDAVVTHYATHEGVAVVELADACGLVRLPGGRLAPLDASSRGVGQVLAAALSAGYREIVLAVGGSASSDGGAGMMGALGAVLRDRDGRELPPGGGALAELETLDLSALHPALADAHIVLASDVDNPLLGAHGAVAIYGPQKGVTDATADRLEAALRRWAELVRTVTGRDDAGLPGAGAAGGVGFAALAFLRARMQPGIELLLDTVGFEDKLRGAQLVITGEGSLDEQTLRGKTPAGVARAAKAGGVRVVAVCGRSSLAADRTRAAGIEQVFALTDLEPDPEICMAQAGPLLTALAGEVARAYLR